MAEYSSHGVGAAGLTTGIIGTSLGVLNGMNNGNGILGGLFGGGCNNTYGRYDAEKDAQIARLETEVKLRDANLFTDQKLADLNDRYERRFSCIESQLAQQAVYNATNTGMVSCLQQQVMALQGLTKVIVPIDNVCPAPMPQYNSWTAPTATT